MVIDATPNGALYSNTLITDYEKWINKHELAHVFAQAPMMGAAYLPLHALSQGLGTVGLPGGYFLEGAPFHTAPYDSAPSATYLDTYGGARG